MASIIEQKEKTDTTDAPSNPPTFTPVNHTFSFLESKKNNELLMKWWASPGGGFDGDRGEGEKGIRWRGDRKVIADFIILRYDD